MAGPNKGGRPPTPTLALTIQEVERLTARRAKFETICQSIGLTPEHLALKIYEATEATVVERLHTADGKGYEDVVRVDHRTRLAAIQVAARLLSMEPPKAVTKDVTIDHRVMSFKGTLPPKNPVAPPPALPPHDSEDQE